MTHKRINRLFLTILLVAIIILLVGCAPNNSSSYRVREITTTSDVICRVTEAHYKYWYASGAHHQCKVSVIYDELGITESHTFNNSDAIKFKNLKENDMIKCRLTLVKTENGDIIRSDIQILAH